MKRETFGSRLGFLLLSAGCAIGIGNVWRFPYVVGNNGGGAFVFFYLFFLVALGLPILSMEFAVGRASRQSNARCFQKLEKPGQKWHLHGYASMVANYVLMMFYTTVAGWMLIYFYKTMTGQFIGADSTQVEKIFGGMMGNPLTMSFAMIIVVVIGFTVNSMGLQAGVEKITKYMMLILLLLMVILAVNSIFLPGGTKGVSFYLVPDFQKMKEIGFTKIIVAAVNQSFFTLSLGIGCMAIFGSYLDKSHSLLGESLNIAILDTLVAVFAGLIIFPACFSYGIEPDSGPKLLFITLPNVFNSMPLGRVWGSLFFVFMSFAALSTVFAVFESIISSCMDLWGWSRKKACLINIFVVILTSLPCVFGFNILSSFQPFGDGSTVLDLEDFLVSNLFLPIGSLIYTLFCVSRYGWGFDNYIEEANTGIGLKMPRFLRFYCTCILPLIVAIIIINGLYTFFS